MSSRPFDTDPNGVCGGDCGNESHVNCSINVLLRQGSFTVTFFFFVNYEVITYEILDMFPWTHYHHHDLVYFYPSVLLLF